MLSPPDILLNVFQNILKKVLIITFISQVLRVSYTSKTLRKSKISLKTGSMTRMTSIQCHHLVDFKQDSKMPERGVLW